MCIGVWIFTGIVLDKSPVNIRSYSYLERIIVTKKNIYIIEFHITFFITRISTALDLTSRLKPVLSEAEGLDLTARLKPVLSEAEALDFLTELRFVRSSAVETLCHIENLYCAITNYNRAR